MKPCSDILFTSIKPWAVQAAGQPFVYFNYNPVGDNIRVYSSVPNDWERNYTYDWLGRRLTYQEGELAETLTYNGGNLSTHSQSWTENGITQSKTTTYHYNAHRLDSVSYDDALTTIYHYNAAGQPFVYFDYNPVGDNTMVYSSVANDWERNYTYDWLGRKLTYTEGEIVETLSYNGGNLSNCIQRWIENGSDRTKNTFYHYTAHRLDSVCYDDALTTIYHYDQYGRVDSLYDESGVMCYTYGNMGEVTNETRIYALPFLSSPVALSTQFTYDSWGRIQNITYPDNEVVNYAYDLGGQLQSITNNSSYTYLDNVTYDRFGAKVSQTYGNGLVTNYSYDNLTRRLSTITTLNGNSQISTFAYTYDPVGNVTQVTSSCPWLQNQGFIETFTYDASDQLTSAAESQNQSYQLAVTYGNWGKINSYSLTQTDLQSNTSQSEAQAYSYPVSGSLGDCQTLFAPEQRTITDANNNVATETLAFGINGSLRKREVQAQASYTEYYLFNSAANLKAYSYDGLDFAYYGYNASNTRSYKLSMLNQNQWVNGQPEPLHLQLQSAMFYPNAYINFNQNGEYTKHYYNGTERIASRLGDAQPESFVISSNDRLGFRTMQADQQARTDLLEVVEAGDVPIETPSVDVTTLQTTGTFSDIFYYHTNHLGSTAFITDNNTNIHQGFLYAPFGEITTEYNANFGNDIIPKYSFNVKELDEETGMYYYEARYYKPPVFTSRDAMFEKYFWMTPYAYCANNPVKYVDPSGREPIKPQAGTISGFITFFNNTRTKMGTLKGAEAHNAMLRLGKTEWSWSSMRPMPATTNPFNNSKDKYIYTKEGGWIDMSHFMFYAGRAYEYKQNGEQYPMGKALKDGLFQEMSDMVSAKHSAFSYEDLPSDKYGADFGANYFDPNSEQTFGEQLQKYFNEVLRATVPQDAPNYDNLPLKDTKNPPSRTNGSSFPVYTEQNP